MTAAQCSSCGSRATTTGRFCPDCGTEIAAGMRKRVGHYTIESVIAEGGMGVVYRAFDQRLQRRVGLKLLREHLASDPEFRARFESESRAAAALDHPNILPIFDAGEADGTLYIATRLVHGQDLRALVQRTGPLPVERALLIVGQIAAALDHAHAQGLVHRDVKPANILVVPAASDEPEHAYLIDFGITKRADGGPSVTAAGRFVGTPDYAAPEQILGEAVTDRSDAYALAGVLYFCLTGRPPFGGVGAPGAMQAHLTAPAPSLGPGFSPSLDAAITRAMDKSPGRRFPCCRAFVAAGREPVSATVTEGPRFVADPVLVAPDAPGRARGSRTLVVAGGGGTRGGDAGCRGVRSAAPTRFLREAGQDRG